MTSTTLERLKSNRAADLQRLSDLALATVFKGTHRKRRLKQSLGALWDQTCLHPPVAKAQAKTLFDRLWLAFGDCAPSEERRQLRFLTVLHQATPLNVEAVIAAIVDFERRLKRIVEGQRTIRLIGVIEIEIQDAERLEWAEREAARKAGKVVKKSKLAGLKNLCKAADIELGKAALVHFHGVIDGGDQDPDKAIRAFSDALRVEWPTPRAVKVDPLNKNKSLRGNLEGLSAYLTKGGNERLQYKVGTIRSTDAALWKDGAKGDPDDRDPDSRGEIDELALGGAEVRLLGQSLHRLATRSAELDGYIVDLSSTPPPATLPGLT